MRAFVMRIILVYPLIFHVNNPVDYLKIVYGKFHDKINSITFIRNVKKGNDYFTSRKR